ncbi:MAG: ECF transporter S component [Bacilli bacterium]|nr:ECF transporter S component [Bacilli bacterium]
MKKITAKDIAIDAIFVAILTVMTFVPFVGMITLPFGSFTLLHLPVLLGAYLFGWRKGLLFGTAMGVLSMIKALTTPGLSPFDLLFIWPWISILPRAIFGFLSGLFFDILHKNSKLYGNPLIVGLLSFAFTVMHTVLVFGSLFIFFPNETFAVVTAQGEIMKGVGAVVAVIILIGMTGEAILAGLVTPAVGKGTMFVAKNFRSDTSREEEKE